METLDFKHHDPSESTTPRAVKIRTAQELATLQEHSQRRFRCLAPVLDEGTTTSSEQRKKLTKIFLFALFWFSPCLSFVSNHILDWEKVSFGVRDYQASAPVQGCPLGGTRTGSRWWTRAQLTRRCWPLSRAEESAAAQLPLARRVGVRSSRRCRCKRRAVPCGWRAQRM